MSEKLAKKLLKYITNDRFKKLKSYVDKHEIILRNIRLKNGENLLHEASREGKGHFVRYFLEKGVDPLGRNADGDVPLHLACHAVTSYGLHVMDDIVRPLMRKCIAATEVSNKSGRKPRDLLRELHSKINEDECDTLQKPRKRRISERDSPWGRPLRVETPAAEAEDEDAKWRRRMAEEMNDEYAEQWGNYENDFCEEEREPDTFDNWAESLHRQRREKQQRQYMRFEQKRESKRKKQEQEQAENRKRLEELEKEHQEYLAKAKNREKLELKKKKEKYSRKIKEFFSSAMSSKEEVWYSSIPWPHLKSDKSLKNMKEFLLCDVDSDDKQKIRKYLKEQQIIWHPDRFMQKCGQYLAPAEKDRILSKVNDISQMLNSYVSEII